MNLALDILGSLTHIPEAFIQYYNLCMTVDHPRREEIILLAQEVLDEQAERRSD